jgi:primary-amine oxidase
MWRRAVAAHGENPDTLTAFPYPMGPFAPANAGSGRLFIAVTPSIRAYVNVTERRVLKVEEGGAPPPDKSRTFDAKRLPPNRAANAPLHIVQANGAGFKLSGHEVSWQPWRFRFSFHPRVGLVLQTVTLDGRSLLYRASLSELFVPYGDRGEGQFHLTAFDAGEAGMGTYGDLHMNVADCPENAVFMPAVMHDFYGQPVEIDRAACLYERDGGVQWRHGSEVRRARQLVLSSIVRVDNYDYGFNWIFGQDGALELEVMLTGLMNARHPRASATEGVGYATTVDSTVEAMNHQHIFSIRLDPDVAGPTNSVIEVNTEAPPAGPANPNGNAAVAGETILRRELDAKRTMNASTNRFWKIVNPAERNALDAPVGYGLMPGLNTVAYQSSEGLLRKRAGFVDAHLWVTPYRADELYAAGDYVNQSKGGDGLPAWTAANRSIENSDVVLWYTLAVTHTPRPEDWPVMPAARVGFKLIPIGFFARNPALDLRREESGAKAPARPSGRRD